MDFFPIILLFVVLVFSLEKNTIGETNTNERNQQLAMRGLFACYIIFSHMYRNSDVFDNNKASTFISIVSPSLLCMFFFYSGYGAMYKYVKKGTVAFCECFATWVKKLIIPAAVAFIAATVLEYITTGSIKPLDLFSVINELGGWFLKTLIILQFVFWFNSKIVRKEKYFVLTLLVMTTVAIAAMRLMGLQSYYYIDCFAFVFGAASYMYSRQCSVLISNAVIVVISGIFAIFMGGGIPILLQKGILPSRLGIGLIVGFINSFTQVIFYQSLIMRFQFKKGNVLKWIGKYSYEIYLAGPCAFIIAMQFAHEPIIYYVLYSICCVCIGAAISKITSFLS